MTISFPSQSTPTLPTSSAGAAEAATTNMGASNNPAKRFSPTISSSLQNCCDAKVGKQLRLCKSRNSAAPLFQKRFDFERLDVWNRFIELFHRPVPPFKFEQSVYDNIIEA